MAGRAPGLTRGGNGGKRRREHRRRGTVGMAAGGHRRALIGNGGNGGSGGTRRDPGQGRHRRIALLAWTALRPPPALLPLQGPGRT
ncbi:hypothetical protein ABLO14_19080 [Mycobacterium tuberculosis]